jgi:hypothetical protein
MSSSTASVSPKHKIVPIAQHPEARFVHVLSSLCVVFGLSGVLAAVEFDDEHCFDASEVGNVGANRVLAAKPEAFDLLAAESPP